MNRRLVIIILSVVGIAVLGLLVSRVGNVGIRRVRSRDVVALQVTDPIMPGASTVIRWAVPWSEANQKIEFRLRTMSGSVALGHARMSDTAAAVMIPCNIVSADGSVQMMNYSTGELISWVAVSILPIGPDCY